MDRFEAMSLLVGVVDEGSLSAASRALKVPLATLSRKISDLEAMLGTRLLTRTTRKLSLTDSGIAYVAAARRILAQVDDAEREATGEFTTPKGDLVVTAPLMFGRLHVLPVVVDFLAMFPEINVKLKLADHNVDLVGDQVDMAVRIGHLPDSSMVATQIGTMRFVTCASPGFLAGHGTPKTPGELADLACVAVDAPTPSPTWRFMAPDSGSPIDIAVSPRLVVSTCSGVAQAAARGIGVTHLSHYQIAGEVARGELALILESYELPAVPVHLLHASRGQMPLKMRRFLDFAAPRLREALRQISATTHALKNDSASAAPPRQE
jgi:DNA-binding transcriptional LysR family regulator